VHFIDSSICNLIDPAKLLSSSSITAIQKLLQFAVASFWRCQEYLGDVFVISHFLYLLFEIHHLLSQGVNQDRSKFLQSNRLTKVQLPYLKCPYFRSGVAYTFYYCIELETRKSIVISLLFDTEHTTHDINSQQLTHS
jgi:hypothetical protein